MRKILAVLTVVILCLIACKESATEPETKELISTMWQLESMEIAPNNKIVPPGDQDYNIRFLPDSTLVGTNSCNKIFGEYELLPNSIIILKSLGTTYAGCPERTFHDNYYKAIHEMKSYAIQNNKLYLNYGENSILIFISR